MDTDEHRWESRCLLECGHRFRCLADSSTKQSRVQRLGKISRTNAFNGDKSPAESGENSSHSTLHAFAAKAALGFFLRVHLWFPFFGICGKISHAEFLRHARASRLSRVRCRLPADPRTRSRR